MSNWRQFGPKIKRLRGETSIKAIAELAGIDRGHLSRLENSKSRPTEETVAALARALHTDIDQLLISAGYLPLKYDEAVAESPGKYHVELKWDADDPIEKSTNEIAQMLDEAVRLEEMTEEEALKVLELAKEHIKIAKR